MCSLVQAHRKCIRNLWWTELWTLLHYQSWFDLMQGFKHKLLIRKMISSSNHRGVEKWDRAEKKANNGCFVLKHIYPYGQLAHNSAGDMLGGRGTRDLGYLFISHDRLRASLGWVLIFQCFWLQWWQKKSPGTESQGLAVKRQRACMEMVHVKKARVGHPSFHFTSQLIFQKISMLSLSPLLFFF